MSTKPEIIDTARLSNKGFSFTLPKRVREQLNIKDSTKPLGFFEENNDEITIGHQGKNLLGSAELSPTFHVTLVKRARERLNIEKGKVIFFYLKHGIVIISANPIVVD